MNLQPLFETQAKLDKRIVVQKELEEQDLLDKKILALQVELGELANEWRGFKFWSEDQEPRTKIEHLCPYCYQGKVEDYPGSPNVETCGSCNGDYVIRESNPFLEEYVDCLHFILSIGNDLGITHENICVEDDLTGINATETFNILFSHVSGLHTLLDVNLPATVTDEDIKDVYHDIFECFIGLGEADLGFTWEQIEQSYYEKNKINHNRLSIYKSNPIYDYEVIEKHPVPDNISYWEPATDNVTNPSHYINGNIETIDYLKDTLSKEQYEGFCRGNVLKYISRYPHKNGVEDLNKAKTYLEWLIESVKE